MAESLQEVQKKPELYQRTNDQKYVGSSGGFKKSTSSPFVAQFKALCSKSKTTLQKPPTFPFLELPDELQLKIVEWALVLYGPRRIVISRPPAPNSVSDTSALVKNHFAGLYGTPHPFLSVSVRFRDMTLIARKLSFAVTDAFSGGEITPARILCDFENDEFDIFPSVLDYGICFNIPDLMLVKKAILVRCRHSLSDAAIRNLIRLPKTTTLVFVQEALFSRFQIPLGTKHGVQHGWLPYRENYIKDRLIRDTRRWKVQDGIDAIPCMIWIRVSRFDNAFRIRGPLELLCHGLRLIKDTSKILLDDLLYSESRTSEAKRRAHWVKTGHWKKPLFVGKNPKWTKNI